MLTDVNTVNGECVRNEEAELSLHIVIRTHSNQWGGNAVVFSPLEVITCSDLHINWFTICCKERYSRLVPVHLNKHKNKRASKQAIKFRREQENKKFVFLPYDKWKILLCGFFF